MHDVGVALHRHVLGEPYRSGRSHAPNVVATEIDEHHVLGALLGVGEQLALESRVLVARRAAAARAGDRPDRHRAVLQPHQDLRGSADHLEVAEIEIEHVRRRVDRTQGAIQRERRSAKRTRQALRQHHLHDVSVVHIADGAPDGGAKRLASEVRRDIGRCLLAIRGQGKRQLERPQQLAQARLGVLPGARFRRVGVDDKVELAGEIVDHGKLLGNQVRRTGAGRGARRRGSARETRARSRAGRRPGIFP